MIGVDGLAVAIALVGGLGVFAAGALAAGLAPGLGVPIAAPLAATAAVATARVLPEACAGDGAVRVDPLGAVLVISALAASLARARGMCRGMPGPSTSRVRVMTWNVWWRFGPAWRDRQRGLLQRLREAGPDLVALQECWGTVSGSQAHEFAEQLDMEAAFVVPGLPPAPDPPEAPDQAGIDVGIGLLSRWPIAAVRAVRMPSRHRRPAPVAMAATVEHPAGSLHVIAACLEWEPAFNDDRIAQARAVADLATAPATDGPLPVILCGDLNAAAESAVLRPVRDVLVDVWAAGGGDPAATTLSSTHPQAPVEAGELIDQRIDHVFMRPGQPGLRIEVTSVAVVGEPVDGLDPSDHKAVLCELAWTQRS